MSAVEKFEPHAPDRQLPAVAVTPMQMLAMAVDRGADIEMLNKLMSLQERWEANEARKAFVVAMSAFKAHPPILEKNKHVKYGNTEYDHATLDQVCGVIGKGLSEHGLSHRWETNQREHDVIEVTCVVTHQLGHSEKVTLSAKPDTSGAKNAIQAIGSAISYLQRYTLLAATGLAAQDMDDDGRRTEDEHITAAQKDELIALMKETNANTKLFLEYMGVATLDEIWAADFKKAKSGLLRKKQEAK
jgi:hypothetical protein